MGTTVPPIAGLGKPSKALSLRSLRPLQGNAANIATVIRRLQAPETGPPGAGTKEAFVLPGELKTSQSMNIQLLPRRRRISSQTRERGGGLAEGVEW